jgi:hypothetical protein
MRRRQKEFAGMVAGLLAVLVVGWSGFAMAQGTHKAWLFIGLFCLGALLFYLSLRLYQRYYSWSYGRKLRRMSPEEQDAEWAKTASEVESLLQEMREERRKSREHPSVSWQWQALDALLGFVFLMGPPLLLAVVRHEPLSCRMEFKLPHLLAMGCGMGVYSLARACAIRLWRRRYGHEA